MTDAVATLADVSLFPKPDDDEHTSTVQEDVVLSLAPRRTQPGHVEQSVPAVAGWAQSLRAHLDTVSSEVLEVDQRGGSSRVFYARLAEAAALLYTFDAVAAPTSAWERRHEDWKSAVISFFRAQHSSQATGTKPTARGEVLLQRTRDAAVAEVRAHLEAGREVYGRRGGNPVVIKPKR